MRRKRAAVHPWMNIHQEDKEKGGACAETANRHAQCPKMQSMEQHRFRFKSQLCMRMPRKARSAD
jgi:hypothetical protein